LKDLEQTILKYKKIFFYAHVPILLGVFAFLLVFVNDKEILELETKDCQELLKTNLSQSSFKCMVILEKDFGFIRSIEIKNLETKKILLHSTSTQNFCIENPIFCQSFSYVRFYY
jgi:hypothetical protein